MSESCPWRAVAALAALATLGVAAQPAAPGAPAGAAAAAMAPAPHATPYRSAFEDYQPYTDEKPVPWKEANETVRSVGGWRAYAKEASSEPAAAPSTGAPATPHHGHGKP